MNNLVCLLPVERIFRQNLYLLFEQKFWQAFDLFIYFFFFLYLLMNEKELEKRRYIDRMDIFGSKDVLSIQEEIAMLLSPKLPQCRDPVWFYININSGGKYFFLFIGVIFSSVLCKLKDLFDALCYSFCRSWPSVSAK